jgi:HEPN domain-containing protein
MTEFLKTKMHFALALLGTLFALHPVVERIQDIGFQYLGVELKVYHAYALIAGLLAFTVYCYALTLLSERSHSWVERLGNYAYALAVMVLPLYGGLYATNELARHLELPQHLALAVPAGLGIGWLLLSQLLALVFRKRLGDQDQRAKVDQLAEQEIASLNRARELFESDHYDLSVIEAWKAIEARLRRVLLQKGITKRLETPQDMIALATKKGLLTRSAQELLQELRTQWNIAVSVEPLTREAADKALTCARNILATIAVDEPATTAQRAV